MIPSSVSAPSSSPSPILRGVCHVLFAFDVGFSVDLTRAAQLLVPLSEPPTTSPEPSIAAARTLRTSLPAPTFTLGRHTTDPVARCALFPFGSIGITFTVPIDGPLDHLLPLATSLYENADLRAAARAIVQELLDRLGPAVAKPNVFESVEDYVVYSLRSWPDSVTPDAILAAHAETLAGILQAQTQPLSHDLVRDTLSSRISFSARDLAIIDWNAAMLFDADPRESLNVIEHANVELLELRFLDRQLDAILQRLHAIATRQSGLSLWPLGTGAAGMRRITDIQADSTLLFEMVNNAMKLVGDQFLARLYRLVSQKFYLPEWDEAVRQRLQAAKDIEDRIAHFGTTRRLEVLEVTIVALIALEIILSLL